MNRTSCECCKYFHADTSQCRRYPPKLVVVSSLTQPPLKDVFVHVSADSFCGEFVPFYMTDRKEYIHEYCAEV